MSITNMIDDDAFIFAGQENDVLADEVDACTERWRILIVDDEPEIHKVSELALDNIKVLNKRLEFLNAYSAKEAIQILQNETDIAVILLDVVMESDDAGLKAVQYIREQLQLTDVRIILRTGQPGYAPEEQVVMQYDINDYRTKTELTRNKLLTSVCSAIRSYSQLVAVRKSNNFLDKLNQLNTKLISLPELNDFFCCFAQGSQELFGTHSDAILLVDKNITDDTEQTGFWQVYGSEKFAQYTGHRYEKHLPSEIVSQLNQVITQQQHSIADNYFIIYIQAQSCRCVLYLATEQKLELPEQLLQTYLINIASELDNALLLKRVSHVAYTCPVTQLPNRARFIELLDDYTANKLTANRAVLVDLDHFSDINDALGHDVGNSLLISVAQRFQQQWPELVIARIGADIFGLIGDDKSLDQSAILSLFEAPFKADEHVIPVNASIGICDKQSQDKTGLSVLKHANIALNRAKKDIRSRYSFYCSEMEDETSWRLGMIRRLNSDFKSQKLEVWYQPQTQVSSDQVIGMESLLRWPDGNGGYISPATFIPLAEYSGLIVDIGAWVIEQSCLELQRLTELGLSHLRVAVNVSMTQFRNSQFVEQVVAIVNAFGIEPQRLELEITESVLMDDPTLVVQALEQLKQAGFNIAIDDFGTGFSSLSYLQKLPIDVIKIDREFIKGIGEGDPGIIAETVIKLAQKLELETVAEGIETDYQLQWLNQQGCDIAQGFLKAKPMPKDKLEAFLQQRCQGKD